MFLLPLCLYRYYKWILERNFHDLNKGVRGNQVISLLLCYLIIIFFSKIFMWCLYVFPPWWWLGIMVKVLLLVRLIISVVLFEQTLFWVWWIGFSLFIYWDYQFVNIFFQELYCLWILLLLTVLKAQVFSFICFISGFSSQYCGWVKEVLQPSLPFWKCWPWLWGGLRK